MGSLQTGVSAEARTRYNAKNKLYLARRMADPVIGPNIRAQKRVSRLARAAHVRDDPVLCAAAKLKDHARYLRSKSTPIGWLRRALMAARTRAKTRGVEFCIHLSDIALPTFCPILGATLTYRSGASREVAPSLDRINPKLGYIVGNVRVISLKANTLRGDCTDPAIFRALAEDAERLFK